MGSAHPPTRVLCAARLSPAPGPSSPSQKHCDRQKANLRIRFKPSLFQHVGTHSSLAGKIQKLKVNVSRHACLAREWGSRQSQARAPDRPSTAAGQGLWEASAAEGAREPAG